MTVIRIVHNQENPFVQLNKKALWNEKLSLKAIGLWARCMSRPDDWRFNIKELATKCKEGRRAIDGAINELIENNYAVRLEHWEKAEDGKFATGGVEYVFFEFPATQEDKEKVLEEFKKFFRHCGFGNSRNGDSRNSNLLIHKEEQKKIGTKKEGEENPPPIQKPPPLLEKGQFVRLSPDEFRTLCEQYGVEMIERVIEEINDYLASRGKKPYKDFAAAIRNWIRKESKWTTQPKKDTKWKAKFQTNTAQYNHNSSDKDLQEQPLPESNLLALLQKI